MTPKTRYPQFSFPQTGALFCQFHPARGQRRYHELQPLLPRAHPRVIFFGHRRRDGDLPQKPLSQIKKYDFLGEMAHSAGRAEAARLKTLTVAQLRRDFSLAGKEHFNQFLAHPYYKLEFLSGVSIREKNIDSLAQTLLSREEEIKRGVTAGEVEPLSQLLVLAKLLAAKVEEEQCAARAPRQRNKVATLPEDVDVQRPPPPSTTTKQEGSTLAARGKYTYETEEDNETCYHISRRFKCDVRSLVHLNKHRELKKLSQHAKLNKGTVLRTHVPVAAAVVVVILLPHFPSGAQGKVPLPEQLVQSPYLSYRRELVQDVRQGRP